MKARHTSAGASAPTPLHTAAHAYANAVHQHNNGVLPSNSKGATRGRTLGKTMDLSPNTTAANNRAPASYSFSCWLSASNRSCSCRHTGS